MPAAQKHDHDQERRRDHVEEFGHEEEQELDARIFGVIAADKLLLGLGQVEGEPRRLGEGGHEKHEEAERLREGVPHARVGLGVHDRVELERPGREHHAQEAEAQRNLVGYELGARAQAAEEAILVVARPAAQEYAVDGDAREREHPQHAHVEARGHEQRLLTREAEGGDRGQRAAEGNRSEDRERRRENHEGRRRVQHFIDMPGREVFLEDDLEAVGEGLAEAEEPHLRERDADAIGALAILHPGRHPALDEHEIGRRRHQAADQEADLHERHDRGEGGEVFGHASCPTRRSTPCAGISPASAANEADEPAICCRTATGS